MNCIDSGVLREMSFLARRSFELAIEHNYFVAIQFDPREMKEADYLEAMDQVKAGPKDWLGDADRDKLIGLCVGFAIVDAVKRLG